MPADKIDTLPQMRGKIIQAMQASAKAKREGMYLLNPDALKTFGTKVAGYLNQQLKQSAGLDLSAELPEQVRFTGAQVVGAAARHNIKEGERFRLEAAGHLGTNLYEKLVTASRQLSPAGKWINLTGRDEHFR